MTESRPAAAAGLGQVVPKEAKDTPLGTEEATAVLEGGDVSRVCAGSKLIKRPLQGCGSTPSMVLGLFPQTEGCRQPCARRLYSTAFTQLLRTSWLRNTPW